MLLWVLCRHPADPPAFRDTLQRVHDRDVDRILDDYRAVFTRAGVKLSEKTLHAFVETVSAILDGMLIRAEYDHRDRMWADLFADAVAAQVRAVVGVP